MTTFHDTQIQIPMSYVTYISYMFYFSDTPIREYGNRSVSSRCSQFSHLYHDCIRSWIDHSIVSQVGVVSEYKVICKLEENH